MDEILSKGLTFFWDLVGQYLVPKAINEWEHFNWPKATRAYKNHLNEIYGNVYVYNTKKTIDEIFIGVFVIDEFSNRIEASSIETTKSQGDGSYFDEILQTHTHPIFKNIQNEKRLILLGKPGSGKSIFLEYLTIEASRGNIPKIPIFVRLREFANKKKDLFSYLTDQFINCDLRDANSFVKELLKNGNALVLFDGLDEVPEQNNQRNLIIQDLKDFASQYSATQIIISCRVAAIDYCFENFTYKEIADFNLNQKYEFISKWFICINEIGRLFWDEINKPKHIGLMELAKTPLLLAILCIFYEKSQKFPLVKTELYSKALDSLLISWDKQKLIQRDVIYPKLTIDERTEMLGKIAYEKHQKRQELIKDRSLARQILAYLNQFLGAELRHEYDVGIKVLKGIESQHGILVEHPETFYSFLSFSLQEYLAADYISRNVDEDVLNKFFANDYTDEYWREVLVMISSLVKDYGNYDQFFEFFLKSIPNNLLQNNATSFLNLLNWVHTSYGHELHSNPQARKFFSAIFLAYANLLVLITFIRDNIFRDYSENDDLSFTYLNSSKSLELYKDLKKERTIKLKKDITQVVQIASEVENALAHAENPDNEFLLVRQQVSKMIQILHWSLNNDISKAFTNSKTYYTGNKTLLVSSLNKVDDIINYLVNELEDRYKITIPRYDREFVNIREEHICALKKYQKAYELLQICLRVANLPEWEQTDSNTSILTI